MEVEHHREEADGYGDQDSEPEAAIRENYLPESARDTCSTHTVIGHYLEGREKAN